MVQDLRDSSALIEIAVFRDWISQQVSAKADSPADSSSKLSRSPEAIKAIWPELSPFLEASLAARRLTTSIPASEYG